MSTDYDLPIIFKPLIDLLNGGHGNGNATADFVSQAESTQSPITQLYISLSIGVFSLLLFCILRLKWPSMYSARGRLLKSPPPKLGESFLGWIIPLFKIKEREVLKLVGLDALMLMRLFKLGAIMFGCFSVYGCFVLMIITWNYESNEIDPPPDAKQRLTIGILKDGDPKIIAHVVGAYLFTAIAFYFLNREYQVYSFLRWSFLKTSRQSITARSVMVEGVPFKLRREDLLRKYFEDLNMDSIEKIQIFHSAADLSCMVAYRSQALRNLEGTVTKWLGNPCVIGEYDPEEIRQCIESGTVVQLPNKRRPTVKTGFLGLMGPKVDAISHQYRVFYDYCVAVRRLRAANKNYVPSGVCFITFSSLRTAHVAAQIVSNSWPFALRTNLAPEPRDIFWSNIHLTARETTIRRLFVYIAMVLVIFFYSIPLSIISSALSLPKIVEAFPALADLKTLSPFVWGLLSGFLPTVATITFISVTPYIFTWLSIIQGAKTLGVMERMTVSKHFLFLLINVVLVFTVSNSLWGSFFGKLIKDPSTLFTLLGSSLTKVSPFFINYVMILGIGYFPVQLLQLGPVFFFLFRRMFSKTPRDFAEILAPVYTDYGWLYGQPLLVFATVMTYSVISPVILIVGTLYFTIGHFVTKYCLLYVYYRNYESGGLLWPLAFRRIMVGIFLFQITLTGQFIMKFPSLTVAMFPLMGLSVAFFCYIRKAYPHDCKYLPIDFLRDNPAPCENLLPGFEGIQGESAFLAVESENTPAKRVATHDHSSFSYHEPTILAPDGRPDQEPSLARPDIHSDYQQSPMLRFNGVLDASITEYANPATYADLPYLWLPQHLSYLQFKNLKRCRTSLCCFPTSLRTNSDYHSTPTEPVNAQEATSAVSILQCQTGSDISS
ncbi:hypothetical protein DSO57_1010360 [Entomophthora muscae]|uniref:Uncharacterized protein n=1 Tax=Entomophthora muscae TaxID=34485 RepID=A0ACC2UFF7_9FUNG|nr:hypothetical protein DSO57_1010360 [Entomophthora muscae]